MNPCRGPLKLQVVETARALIEDERYWCRNELARDANGHSVDPTDPRAVRRCGLGALMAAAHQITNDRRRAYEVAVTALRPLNGSTTLVMTNVIRGHAAVLALLDEALSRKQQ